MLSVVIPCLNEVESIGRLLESLQQARAEGVELLLVDGGSTDDTLARAAPMVDKVIVTAPGRARQMNAGSQAASGELLWFLHADSGIGVDFPASIVSAMAGTPRAWGWFKVRLSGRHPFFRIIEFMMNGRSRLTGIATGDQAIFVRRELFLRLGGYLDIPLMEDVELSRRLKGCSRPVVLQPRLVTSSRRWERAGILSTVWLMWRLRWSYFMGTDPVRLARRYR